MNDYSDDATQDPAHEDLHRRMPQLIPERPRMLMILDGVLHNTRTKQTIRLHNMSDAMMAIQQCQRLAAHTSGGRFITIALMTEACRPECCRTPVAS